MWIKVGVDKAFNIDRIVFVTLDRYGCSERDSSKGVRRAFLGGDSEVASWLLYDDEAEEFQRTFEDATGICLRWKEES